MTDQDYQEGYCDGLAGIGAQDRFNPFMNNGGQDYDDGFLFGSFDRKAMLAKDANHVA